MRLESERMDTKDIPNHPNALGGSWHPITNKRELKVLAKAMSEAGELINVLADSITIGGIDKSLPNKPTNRKRLCDEIADVETCLRLLHYVFNLDGAAIEHRIRKKMTFLINWIDDVQEK